MTRTYQSQIEKFYIVKGKLIGAPSFQNVPLRQQRKVFGECSQYFTTFIYNDKEVFIKQNGCLWLGGFLAAQFI